MTILTLKKAGLLVVCLVLTSVFSNAQLHADFNADTTSGCAPLVVHFSDASTGNPTGWYWDLGNGTVSYLTNPSASYFLPGFYNIKLVITNASGADSIVRSSYIEVYHQPTINFSANTTSGCYPLHVQFSDLSNAGDGSIASWQWDFGDGTFGNEQNPVHTYTATGSYNVSLIATNNYGCSKNLTQPQFIQVTPGVIAGFTNSSHNGCTAPSTINFQNTSQGSNIASYLWDFGDGSTSTEENPSHVYQNSGNYQVTLIAINNAGCSDTLTRPNAVSIGSIHSDFNAPDSICRGYNINFVNTSTPQPGSAFWDFGDGTTSTELNPQKKYLTVGTYTIKLVNNFGACTDSVSKQIVVNPMPNVDFISTDTSSCVIPFTVHFTNNTTDATSYKWFFGDGSTSTLSDPVHTYTGYGNYTVKLIAYTPQGCTNSITKNDFVKIQPPVASILNLTQEGCAPFEWTFTSSVQTADSVASYLWDFGDGNTSTEENPTHVFDAGNYNIKLIVTTANGCTDTVVVNNGIKVGSLSDVGFFADPVDACAQISISFTDTTSTPVDRWLWDFGDGNTSTQQNPDHTYSDTGYFNIQLIVWNNGCQDTLTKTNYIHIKPPIASFLARYDCSTPYLRTFTDYSIGADEWYWDFGDGNTSTDQNTVHTYSSPGTYTVTLTVTNHETGCDYVSTQTVRVIDELADFTASQTEICRYTTVNFATVGLNNINISSYNWNFGDGTSGSGATPSHTYTQSGLYDVRLIIKDRNGCSDTAFKSQYITVNGPTAGFTVSPTTTCLLSDVTFTDTSHSDGIHPIETWSWNYGDGQTETLNSGPFAHHYIQGGIYSITLTVTDNLGCSDSIKVTNAITVSNPNVNFSTSDTLACPGNDIHFTNTSSGNVLTYTWDFGDGSTTSTDHSPVHVYSADGVYDIKLIAQDQYGCSDSLIRQQYVTIVSPVADFTVSDSIGTCPPLIVNFTNTSTNFISLTWDFGDGTTSNLPNPSHFYNIPGEYFAKLTVTGVGGCTAEKVQRILVKGPYGHFTYTPTIGCAPLGVRFTGTTHDRISFIWDFSDGTTVATTDSIISHTYTTPGQYVPKMILIDIAGCAVAINGSDTIHVYGVTADMSFDPPVVCDQGTVVFTNGSVSNDAITGYEWNFGDGVTSGATDTSHFYSAAGTYYPSLIASTLHGCTDTIVSTTPVKIVATPIPVIAQSDNGCVPVTIDFNGTLAVADTSQINWNWNFGNGTTSNLQHPDQVAYPTAGMYHVSLTVTNSLGCSDTAYSQVEAYPIPVVSAGGDVISCYGTGKTIQVTGADTYQWSPAEGLSCNDCDAPVANPDTATDYIITGTTIHGCSAKDTIHVSVAKPIHVTGSQADSLCKGSAISLSVQGASSYQWYPSDGLSSSTANQVIARPDHTVTYEIVGFDNVGCFTDTFRIPVKVYNIPTVEAGPDVTMNVGQSIDLIPEISNDVVSATWSPTGGIYRSDWPSITVKPNTTTTYTIDVKNAGGCMARDSRTIYVICDGANVFIPNTFSPNGDGINDVFFVRGTGLFNIKTARIFNRWGEMVYQKSNIRPNDQNSGWDGTYKGRKLTPDVYVYIIEITCDNNTVLMYKGNIALIK